MIVDHKLQNHVSKLVSSVQIPQYISKNCVIDVVIIHVHVFPNVRAKVTFDKNI